MSGTVTCEVKAFDEKGKLIKKVKSKGTILDNFGKLWSAMFREWDVYRYQFKMVDTSGTEQNYCASDPDGMFLWNGGIDSYVHVGDGAGPISRADYSLGNEIAKKKTEDGVWLSEKGAIKWATSFDFGNYTTLNEAGFSYRACTTGAKYPFVLMFKNTFSDITAIKFTIVYSFYLKEV